MESFEVPCAACGSMVIRETCIAGLCLKCAKECIFRIIRKRFGQAPAQPLGEDEASLLWSKMKDDQKLVELCLDHNDLGFHDPGCKWPKKEWALNHLDHRKGMPNLFFQYLALFYEGEARIDFFIYQTCIYQCPACHGMIMKEICADF